MLSIAFLSDLLVLVAGLRFSSGQPESSAMSTSSSRTHVRFFPFAGLSGAGSASNSRNGSATF